MGRIAHRGWHFPSPAILHGKASGGGGGGTAASAFITRAQGVGTYDSTHQTAITTFINGLITDGLMNSDGTSSLFDVLYVFAAPLSGQGLLNVVANGLYDGVAHGSPTFTADSGFTGVDSSSTVYLDTGFNPATATGPNYTQDSAHLSIWLDDVTASTSGGGTDCGAFDTGTPNKFAAINVRYSDNSTAMRCNDANSGASIGSWNKGLWLVTRTGSGTTHRYNNTASIADGTDSSVAPPNMNLYVLAGNLNGSPSSGSGRKAMSFSCGAQMSATQVGNFRSRLDTYLTTIAGISY